MAQDSVSPVSFFDVSSKSKGKDDLPLGEADGFSAALNKATSAPSSNGAGHQSEQLVRKLDKPKVDSHQPFFPRKPMPYHPDDVPVATAAGDKVNVHMKGEELNDAEGEGLDVDNAWDSSGRVGAQIDDRSGVIGKNYDGSAVSYPVSRIAKESLDEKTKDDLEKKGLWSLPTMVMAQPNPQMASMKEVVAQGRQGMSSSSVPVQRPVAQFMASLENELGVTPDRLVQAFQNLPPGQLQMSPEKTMVQVVKQLGLKGDDEVKAMALYSKMLAQMQMLDGNDKMQASPLLAGGRTGQKLEGQFEKQLASQSQFSEGENPQVAAKPVVVGRSFKDAEAPTHQMVGKEIAAPVADKGNDVFQNAVSKHSDSPGAEVKASGYENLKNQNSFSQGSNLFQGQNQMASQHEQAPVKDQVKFDLKHDLSAEKATKVEKPMMDLNSLGNQQVDSKPQVQHVGQVGSGLAVTEMKADSANAKHEAIQSIINNAQMLANKGGGEMKMTLKPDHLGEIQLKVAMEGNHVNVQMVTERGEVKKLIEQSVHELRHGLAQHDLSMNKLDVSVGDRSTGSFKQGMPDFSAAREFANQFHQQNGRREMMEGLSMLRNSGRSGLPERMDAMGSAASSSRSGRLNVVA